MEVKINTTSNYRNLNGQWLEVKEVVGTRVSCLVNTEEHGIQTVDFTLKEVTEMNTTSFNIKSNTPQPTKELKRELFKTDVIFNNSIAKWENYKHPKNKNFQQKIFWAAWVANGNLIVVYYLDKTNIGNTHSHAVIPIGQKSFEDAVFEYWSNN
jgi:hypothetical protein